MLSVSCIVQITTDSVRSLSILVIFKIDADAVGFMVTEQFTGTHIRDLDGFYFVVHQAFVSEEEKRRERQCPTSIWKESSISFSEVHCIIF